MRNIEVSAKTVDLAKEKGLQMLGVDESQVVINVIENGSMLVKAKIEMVLFDNAEEKEAYINESKNKKPKATVKVQAKKEEHNETEREDLTEIETSIINRLTQFLSGLMEKMKVEFKITSVAYGDDITIKVFGENLGGLIGYRGDSLDATQTIINGIVRSEFPDYHKKVFLDIENYRAKREDALVSLAGRMANKVLQVKKSLKLEPMNSFERRIIHTALSEIEHIGTHSEGEEPNRYLVIDYVK